MIEITGYVVLLLYALYRYHLSSEAEEDWFVHEETIFNKYNNIIEKYITYYRHLSEVGKHRFISRCLKIKTAIEFRGREGFEMTDEAKILLSASLAQLTYGFQRPDFPFMKGVVVYPEAFYSRMADNWVKGLAMGNGVVFLSWADFIKGYENNSDTYNVGLHEFAHMLNMQANESFYADKRISEYYQIWNELSHHLFIKLRNKEEDFFRAYGGTNKSEFFSVCIENFFEVPQQFEKELPELYYHLCYLLKQNPLNIGEDYRLTKEAIVQANDRIEPDLPTFQIFKTNFEYRFWHILSSVTYAILFCEGMFFILTNAHTQLIMLRFVLVTAAVFIAVRWHYYNTIKAIAHFKYLKHLFFELIPIALLMILFLA